MTPTLGEIRMFGGNFAPRSWALCNGQLLSISENQALFSILGTTFGGDGRTTFALPDMRGRAAISAGTGPGLTPRPLGQRSGQETVTLNQNQIPSHNHFAVLTTNPSIAVTDEDGSSDEANGHILATAKNSSTSESINAYAAISEANEAFPINGNVQITLSNTGGGQDHNNMQPYQVVNFIIALQGLFPSRS